MKNILTIVCVAMFMAATSCKAQDMYKEIDDISYYWCPLKPEQCDQN